MSVKLKVPVSAIKKRLGLQPKGPVHSFLTAEFARQTDRFVPFDTGALAGTVIENGQITENVTADTITYMQNYAKVVYYGLRNGKPIKISQEKHNDATTYWAERAWTIKGPEIVQSVQDYINRGGK